MKKKPQKPDATHLTLDRRKIIEAGIGNGATKADIGRTIGKDATTVAKEIRKHRQLLHGFVALATSLTHVALM